MMDYHQGFIVLASFAIGYFFGLIYETWKKDKKLWKEQEERDRQRWQS